MRPKPDLDGDAVPGAADADAVGSAGAQRLHHMHRRHRGEAHERPKGKVAGGKEQPQLAGMRGEWKHRRDRQRIGASGTTAARGGSQRQGRRTGVLAGAVRRHLAPQRRRDGDRVAVEVERERRR